MIGLLVDIAGAFVLVGAFAGVVVLFQKWRYRQN